MMKRCAQPADIGYRFLRWRFSLARDHIGQPLVRIRQRVHRAIPPEEKEFVTYDQVLPAFISSLERALSEIQDGKGTT